MCACSSIILLSPGRGKSSWYLTDRSSEIWSGFLQGPKGSGVYPFFPNWVSPTNFPKGGRLSPSLQGPPGQTHPFLFPRKLIPGRVQPWVLKNKLICNQALPPYQMVIMGNTITVFSPGNKFSSESFLLWQICKLQAREICAETRTSSKLRSSPVYRQITSNHVRRIKESSIVGIKNRNFGSAVSGHLNNFIPVIPLSTLFHFLLNILNYMHSS